MKWIMGIAIVGFLFYYSVIVKYGNLKFWKVANDHPEEAYVFFDQNTCFIIYNSEPSGDYKANLPPGVWHGPFKFPVPSQSRVVIIYGRSHEYQTAQEIFVRSLNG